MEKLFWGDLHNHCNITYGYGSLENALRLAKTQLDFVSVTGHAMWPDPYRECEGNRGLLRYHQQGFEKLRRTWETVRATVAAENDEGKFVTFQGYEMHSTRYGDHHFVTPDDNLPLFEANSPSEWIANCGLQQAIAIPHHIAYTPGYRGIDWDAFEEKISPVVEVFSKHGCSISSQSPYPYFHDMGPRDGRNTVLAGLRAGYRFGFVASTDHHAGFPGSYGDGRLAVWAESCTRASIWDAICARRTYAVTGDKIEVRFDINGAPMGSKIACSTRRNIHLDVKACDGIDKLVLFKNGRPFRVVEGALLPQRGGEHFKVRIEFGWGNLPLYHWMAQIRIKDGILLSAEPCFRGTSLLSPLEEQREDNEVNDLHDEILHCSSQEISLVCDTFRNIYPQQPVTSAVILEIAGDASTELHGQFNDLQVALCLGELFEGSRSFQTKDYPSPSVLFHQTVSESQYAVQCSWIDCQPERKCDSYFVEVRQTNGQCAWISPIYVT